MKLLRTDSGVVGITAWLAIKNRSAQRIMGALVCLVLSASGASAATLNVVGGELLGASGVIVDGSPYDVAFLDGTCIALYDGCDDVSDFTFQSQAAAVLASQALLDQVFLNGADLFDSDPELTVGCSSVFVCRASTPYDISFPGFVTVIRLENQAPGSGYSDGVSGFSAQFPIGDDLGGGSSDVFAVWTTVPEPGTALLMGLGLLGLGMRRRA